MTALFAVETRIRDLVAGDYLVAAFDPVTRGLRIARVELGPDNDALVWYDNSSFPFCYDGRHGLSVVRSKERVIRDLVRVFRCEDNQPSM